MDWVSKDCLVGGLVFDFLEFGCLMILIELGSVEEREGCLLLGHSWLLLGR